jgi:hypothetical protein
MLLLIIFSISQSTKEGFGGYDTNPDNYVKPKVIPSIITEEEEAKNNHYYRFDDVKYINIYIL